ncbi:thiol:disulfide interchange protein DsbA/DsbL [uncultured Oceanicoccus sp.]|uniref:thiol:disulfide interchange protein DsbA/DsbL n=1 Tax=uncultured Oceanicoccus sp. TaxID=1706381 RepID=UPI0030D878A3
MNRFIKAPVILAVLALIMTSAFASAQEPVPGKNYIVLDQPVRTRDSSKVEVVEVFWYGCSHCYSFEPLIKQWKKRKPDYVDFWQSPAMWNGTMKTHAAMFYTAEILDVMDKLHDPIFTAMNVERKRLATVGEIEDFFADYGVDRQAFRKAFKSFSVNSMVKQADARARSYKITGTPEVVVNGKYRVSARLAGGQAEMLKVVDFLIEKERALLVK